MRLTALLLFNTLLVSCHYYDALQKDKPTILIDFDNIQKEGGGQIIQGLPPIGTFAEEDYLDKDTGSDRSGRNASDVDLLMNPNKWSSCNDFKNIGAFKARYVLNHTWIPFFVWSTGLSDGVGYLNFTVPTNEVVESYRVPYEILGLRLNWRVPKLLMIDPQNQFLLVSADRSGLFHLLVSLGPGVVNNLYPGQREVYAPDITIRIKVIGPLLLVMDCFTKTSVLFAPMGQVPPDRKSKTSVAEGIGFKGIGFPLRRRTYAFVTEEEMQQSKSEFIRQRQKYFDSLGSKELS